MIAHIRGCDKYEQSLAEHCGNTAMFCSELCKKIGMSHLGFLAGLIHDMGKANENYQIYLKNTTYGLLCAFSKGELHHAPVGAIFAYEMWYKTETSQAERLTAQILAMVIHAHHSGFGDILSLSKTSPFHQMLRRDKNELSYDESLENYYREVCGRDVLEKYYLHAVKEVEVFWQHLKSLPKTNTDNAGTQRIFCALLARHILSCLVDADRWDSSCFEYGISPFECFEASGVCWNKALNSLESFLNSLQHDTTLDKIRQEISDSCAEMAECHNRLYRMTVPTGGGKTFSSLRFALKKAEQQESIERIFYIIPYNTILDQNADEIRKVLNDTVPILEHHSNVSYETMAEDEIENHRKLTERWDIKGIILTSMVQFLNSIFRIENSDTRRMNHLTNSILIFDEIQSLPKACTRLFETAIQYLTDFCNCTVVLCTATQPFLEFRNQPVEIIPLYHKYYDLLKRTQVIDESKISVSNTEALEKILYLMKQYRSVLMIVNTKKEAAQLYEMVKQEGIPAIHLSTNMYPEHRRRLIRKIKERDKNQPLFCVSTALIEAGINISFPCVIRSIAGLGNILQAAGRCNRNAELSKGQLGDVYIWKLSDESLRNLEEIERCAEVTKGVLHNNSLPDSLETIQNYYIQERKKFENELEYPVHIHGVSVTLYDLLGNNRMSQSFGENEPFILKGAYRTVGENFRVIDAVTHSVLVQDGRGETLYHLLSSELPMNERIRYMREAGKYSISVYQGVFRKLLDKNVIFSIRDGEMFVLKKENYSQETGITEQDLAMELLMF